MEIRFYYSFRSPYAWIAALRLRSALGSRFCEVERIPYWEPDAWSRAALEAQSLTFPYKSMSRERHLYILEDVKRLAAEVGESPRWPVDPPEPWWEPPHLAAIVAERLGRGEEFFWAIYKARWLEGRDVTAQATLGAVARDLGLDEAAIVGAPDDEALRSEGAEMLAQATRDRAFGVPFFVVGRNRYWGQDRVDAFLRDSGLATPDRSSKAV